MSLVAVLLRYHGRGGPFVLQPQKLMLQQWDRKAQDLQPSSDAGHKVFVSLVLLELSFADTQMALKSRKGLMLLALTQKAKFLHIRACMPYAN